MVESTWEVDNVFIPKYVPNNLKWYERHGLDTWYLQNKSNEFLENTDLHFKQRKVVNFDIIKNGENDKSIQQYNQLDHDEIKKYPPEYQEEIMSSIFHAGNRKNMVIKKKKTIGEHFKKPLKSFVPPKGRGKFLKKIRDDWYASCW